LKSPGKDVLRLIDANVNRAAEGMRVLEETARMLFDDRELTMLLKDIRHSLAAVINREEEIGRRLLSARGSERDVLRHGETESERKREDVISVVRANSKRVQEAVRAIEEYSKLCSPRLSGEIKNIRFRLYDVEKMLVSRAEKKRILSKERLAFFTVMDRLPDGVSSPADFAGMLIGCGAGTVAYHNPASPDGMFVDEAFAAAETCRGHGVGFIVFNRLDCAIVSGADGVHIEPGDISPERCRNLAGENFVLGCSLSPEGGTAHDMQGIVDYFFIGNGVDEFTENGETEETVSSLSRPVVYYGFVSPGRVSSVFACGMHGVAVRTSRIDLKGMERLREAIDSVEV